MKKYMKAMVISATAPLEENKIPLREIELSIPEPADDEILVRVTACGVCHTELDEIEARTLPAFFPIIPGHQVTGIVEKRGKKARLHEEGSRVGVGWIFSTCGACEFCTSGRENLCIGFKATGRDAHGGFAQYMTVKQAFAFSLPATLTDRTIAPLLCAGAVGYRALRKTRITDGAALGFSGFGSSAHLVIKLARHLYPRVKTFVFAKSPAQREFARSLGANWAGDFHDSSPEPMDAVIDTTPVWEPLISLLPSLKPGGRFVINAISKENIDKDVLTGLEYEKHLWREKEISSVANVSREDIRTVLALAEAIPIIPEITAYPLERANEALQDIRKGNQRGAKVLVI